MLTLWVGGNKQGQQWRRLKSKRSHYLKWARFVGGGPCSRSINPHRCWLFYVSEERCTHIHTHWPPSLGVRGILMCQRCRGTERFPTRWHGDYEDSRPACAAQPVWMSANISHQLPSTWDIRWYLSDPVAVLIQEAISFSCNEIWFVLVLGDNSADMWVQNIYQSKAGSPILQPNQKNTHTMKY